MFKRDNAIIDFMPYPRQLADEKEKELAEAYLSGKTIRDLKEKYHLGDKLIRNALRRQGIKFRPLGTKGVTIKLPINPQELGYIAGIIDGEGWLTWHKKANRKNSKYPFIGVANTNPDLLKYLELTIGGKTFWRPEKTGRFMGETKKLCACGNWELHGTLNIITLLRAIIPSLIIKRRQAEEMLAELEKRVRGGFKCE
jgi:hypothetical protein